jgi:excisionase family DNA binding protein
MNPKVRPETEVKERKTPNPLLDFGPQRTLGHMPGLLRKATEGDSANEDRLMTARQVATYLSVNERTVIKLVSEGALPGLKIGNQWRFRKAMLDTWLDDQMLGVGPRYLEVPERVSAPVMMLNLASCFQPSHIIADLSSRTRNDVIAELASHANNLGLVHNRTWFERALIERENVMPSGAGNGVAFMHTLYRHPEQVMRPFMVLGRSREGVDFDALDSKPVHVFFVLGLKFKELHLPWLTKLWQMCSRGNAIEALMRASTANEIFAVLSDAERSLIPATGNS